MTQRPTISEELSELWRFRFLLKQLVVRELRVRYKNSVLGFAWSVMPPLLQVLIYSFLFGGLLGVKVPSQSAYLLCGIIPWTFFSTGLLDSSQSLLTNYNIIKKVYLPREIIPLSYAISNFIHFVLGWVVFFGVFCLILPLLHRGGIPILPSIGWFPLLVIAEGVLVAGLSLWVAALNVFYEDVKFILMTLFQLLLVFLPILYPADLIYYLPFAQRHPWLFQLYMANPIAAIINSFRMVLLQSIPPGNFNPKLLGLPPMPLSNVTIVWAIVSSFIIAISGYFYFVRVKWHLTERA